jgi:hypothetical protein
MIEEEEIEIDPFLQSKPKKQKRNIDDDEDEVDELMAASDSTDYEGEDTYDSDDDAISDEVVK